MAEEHFDPFQDLESAGYLRNSLGLKDKELLRGFELAVFSESIKPALRFLQRQRVLEFGHILEVHRLLFSPVYLWAGHDRSVNFPGARIAKAGHRDLFVHSDSIQRAADYTLSLGQDVEYFRAHPGEVFTYLAYAHPFLDGNGRTILTVHDELCRRADFHVSGHDIGTEEFLTTLTRDLENPKSAQMDVLVKRYL